MTKRREQRKLAEKLYLEINQSLGEDVWDNLMADAECHYIGINYQDEIGFRRNWLEKLGSKVYQLFINLYSEGIFE